MPKTYFLCGSPRLPNEYGPLLDRVISVLAGTGTSVAVTCAAGASSQVLVRASSLGCLAAVFAVGDVTGAGFWGGCGPFCQLPMFGRERVRWLAGGPMTQPLPVRLAERTRACLRFCATSAPGARLVAFMDRPDCGESLSTCQLGMGFGLDVVVFPCGFEAKDLPLLAEGGQWVPAGPGVWAEGVLWSPPRPAPPSPPVSVPEE